MQLGNESDLIKLVEEDEWMMAVLNATQSLRLPDWWVCAGFVRSKIWDTLHGFPQRTPLPDVDVVYFDQARTDERVEKEYEEVLRGRLPSVPWSVKNQARMHAVSGFPPYASSVDGIAGFPETATALGLSLDGHGRVLLAAPYGIADAARMIVKPSPRYIGDAGKARIYEERVRKKAWNTIWPKIEIVHVTDIPREILPNMRQK